MKTSVVSFFYSQRTWGFLPFFVWSYVFYTFSPVGCSLSLSLSLSVGLDSVLLVRYSTARNTWSLGMTDLCEIARNSVLQSDFGADFKAKWLGQHRRGALAVHFPPAGVERGGGRGGRAGGGGGGGGGSSSNDGDYDDDDARSFAETRGDPNCTNVSSTRACAFDASTRPPSMACVHQMRFLANQRRRERGGAACLHQVPASIAAASPAFSPTNPLVHHRLSPIAHRLSPIARFFPPPPSGAGAAGRPSRSTAGPRALFRLFIEPLPGALLGRELRRLFLRFPGAQLAASVRPECSP